MNLCALYVKVVLTKLSEFAKQARVVHTVWSVVHSLELKASFGSVL